MVRVHSNVNLRVMAKKTVFIISTLVTLPMILAAWVEKKTTNKEEIFVTQGQFLSLFPGLIGVYLRAAYYFVTLEKSSWQIHIGFGSIFSSRIVHLGDHVSLGSYCVIGSAFIGDGVLMASRVSIPSGRHQHLTDSGEFSPIPRFDKVTIGKQTWIGEGAIILADVGANCIVGAGAVVTKTIPDKQIIAGNPARPIKQVFGL